MQRFHWFDEARFGLFLHWGIYAIPAKGEWQKSFECMSDTDYDPYFRFFNPDLFNPQEWAAHARDAGMKYVVLTAKHHDGFCLWDSHCTEYSSKKAPRCQKDLLAEFIPAFRDAGLQIGLYYSLPDWHHPNYCIDARHPLRKQAEIQSGEKKILERNSPLYAEFMRNQIQELLTGYGKIDLLWFDGGYPETKHVFEIEKLHTLIRQLQPDILINRLYDFSDFNSPEQQVPDSIPKDSAQQVLRWEGCQVMNHGWGYSRDNIARKSGLELIQMLIRHVSRNGNLLLNIGPTSRGCFPQPDKERLQELAVWMSLHSRSIYGCGAAPEEYPEPAECRYTWNEKSNILYLHCFAWPDRRILLPGLAEKVEFAQLLQDGSEIKTKNCSYTNGKGNCQSQQSALELQLPIQKPEIEPAVIELFFRQQE